MEIIRPKRREKRPSLLVCAAWVIGYTTLIAIMLLGDGAIVYRDHLWKEITFENSDMWKSLFGLGIIAAMLYSMREVVHEYRISSRKSF